MDPGLSDGYRFDRVLDGFDGPFETIPYGELQSFPSQTIKKSHGGYLISSAVNNAFIAVNDLLKAGISVYRVTEETGDFPAGSFYVPARGERILKESGEHWGVAASPVSRKPGKMIEIKPSRIALFDIYGGSMTSGWTRWLMEQFHFPFDRIYTQEIDAGNLNKKYDLVIFMNGTIPAQARRNQGRVPKVEGIPEEFRNTLGGISGDKSIPQLKAFMENGGRILTVGSSTSLAYDLNLPVKNALVKTNERGEEEALSSTDYYVPGSILKAYVDTEQTANWGMQEQADIVFNNSPVFTLKPGAESQGIVPLSWFGDEDLLRSGWAWGAAYLHTV